ncbi:MAG TPA: PKD domain-containing protein, partial [Nitriliruptorales bacterium]
TAEELDRTFSDFGEGWTDNYADNDSEDELWHFQFDCLAFEVASMDGTDIGPLDPPYNLIGDVDFTIGDGCAAFDYGHGPVEASATNAPTARAQAKPAQAAVGQAITFDGSGSSDGEDAPGALAYSWDFGDGATADGQTVTHAYTKVGTYTVTLTVVDSDGNAASDTIEVTVGATPGSGSPLPATGGGLALLGLLAIGGALRLRRA